MSTVCAIIPTYNRAHMIRECIDSLLAQSYPLHQIIVVDDGSVDNTIDVIQSYGDDITILTQPNRGKSAALNLALKHCQSDYVWICDDDDIADKNGLRHLVDTLDENPSAAYSFGTYRIFENDGKNCHYAKPQYNARDDEPNYKICFMEGLFTFQFSTLYRHSILREAGGFREDLVRSQDYEMAIRISRKYDGAFTPQIIFFQRKHDGNRGNAHDCFEHMHVESKWLEYDQIFFTDTVHHYAIEEFMPSFATNWIPDLKLRSCHIQKACIFANRGLWDIAVAHMKLAHQVCSRDLTKEEAELPARSISKCVIPWIELDKSESSIYTIQALGEIDKLGYDIAYAFARPIMWNTRILLKQKNFARANKLIQLFMSLTEPSSIVTRLLKVAA